MQGALWVQLTQTLICNDKVNDGAYFGLRPNFPPGTWTNHTNPDASTGAAWGYLIPSYTGFIRSLSRGLQARGFVEEVLAPYGFTATRSRAAGSTTSASQSATTNFGLSCVGGGGEDGRRRARLRRGHVEPRGRHGRHGDVGAARALPLPRASGSSPTRPGRDATAAARATSACGWCWKTPFYEIQNIGNGTRVRELRPVGRLSRRASGYRHNIRQPNFFEVVERGEPYPTHEPDPEDSDLARMITGGATSTRRRRRCPRR